MIVDVLVDCIALHPKAETEHLRSQLICLSRELVGIAIGLKVQQGGSGGFTADSGCDSSTAVWRVLAGGINQAFLDKYPLDAAGLHSGHRPCGVGLSEVLNTVSKVDF